MDETLSEVGSRETGSMHLRRTRFYRCCMTALAVAGVLWPSFYAGASESMRVPGGTAAVARLIGPIRQEPEEFVHSLNQALLASIDPGHAWKENPRRVALHDFLEDVARLEARFSQAVIIGPDVAGERKKLKALASELGYKMRLKKGRLDLQPREGDGPALRRQVAQALDWDLLALERRRGGEPTVFELAADALPLPVSAGEWFSMAGNRAHKKGPLFDLVEDQRLSLQLRARNRMTAESWAALAAPDRRDLALPLFRYAATLRVRNGAVQVPGGAESAAVWKEITEGQVSRPADFFRRLLDRKGARPAYLWHALSFVPDEVARFYLGTGSNPTSAKALYRRLDEIARVDFDAPRGGDLGFGALVRALPIDTERGELLLPGGLGLWFTAIKAADPPRDAAGVRRIAEKGLRRDMDAGEFLKKALTEEADVAGVHRPVLPRLIRTANLFPSRRDLMTPELVVLAARASDTMPLSLDVLHDLQFTDAVGPRDYLLAAAHLDDLVNNVDRELLILNFQGGTEWLRTMARAGKVEPQALTRRLADWGRIHQQVSRAGEAAVSQLSWVSRVLEDLPPAPHGSPGRGPLEQALIQAIVEPSSLQEFSWKGLDYRGERGGDFARAMAERLITHGVVSADLLFALDRSFTALEAACRAEALEEALAQARTLRGLVAQLPPLPVEFARSLKQLGRRVFPHDRARLQRLVQEILKVKKAKRLPGKIDEIERARETLAGDLKSFLLAPAYLVAMRDEDNFLFEDPHLIRRHLALEELGPDLTSDNPWKSPQVVVESELLGAHLRGHVGGVGAAIAQFSGLSGGRTFLARDEMWLSGSLRTRWHDIDPALGALTHSLVVAGDAILDLARSEISTGIAGSATAFVAARVPLHRLEKEVASEGAVPHISPSERLLLGLGSASEDGFGPLEVQLPDEVMEQLEAARNEAGEDWQSRLQEIGVAAPDLDGSVRLSLHYLAPYELVENETLPRALWQRELLDLKVAVVDYLGRHRLPGAVGFDLMAKVLRDASSSMPQTGPHDWENHVYWVNQLDETYFSERMRECLAAGLYRAQGF